MNPATAQPDDQPDAQPIVLPATHVILYVEQPPTTTEQDQITAVIADGQRLARLESPTDSLHFGGHGIFAGAIYAGSFTFVSEALIEAFVAKLPLRGDVLLYARTSTSTDAHPLLRVRPRPAIATAAETTAAPA